MDYHPRRGPPSWTISEPYKTSRSSSAQLELWPVSKIATEFASDGILSHVWGSDLKVVEIEGVDVLLKQDDPTKLELLRHVIKSGSNGCPRIWVDILDIDQENDAIKFAQIEQLLNLYKSKNHTIIYHSEDPESLASTLLGESNRKIFVEVLDVMLRSCEHSLRVWTLQEFVLAQKVVHVFRTPDPTMVLVAHEQFKEVFNKLPAYERNGLATWFLREGDSRFNLPWNSPAEIIERLPPIRYCTQIHDYVNGRASIYGITPIGYETSMKDLFQKLLEFDDLMHLSGDFLCVSGENGIKKAIIPKDEVEMQRFLLRWFQTVSERKIQFREENGKHIKELLLARIWLPYLKNGKFNSVHSQFVQTNQGWAFQVTARIIRPDEEFLVSLQYLGTAKVEWWKPENQEQRVFLYNHKLCGFESDGRLVDFPWKRSPFVVPYVAVIGTTVFLIKSISDSEVILGSPAGHYYGYSEGTTHQDAVKPKPYFERDVMLPCEVPAVNTRRLFVQEDQHTAIAIMPLRAAPQVIVHPPQEEEEEPCLSYCAPEEPAGLSNPLKLRTLSLTHAILQVLMALPETTEELPVESNHEPTRLFTNLIRQIHTSPTAEPLDLSWILSETNLITTTATEISSVEKYDSVLRYMLATLLGPTKMGQRFHLETITIDNLASASESLTNLYSTSTAASLPSLDSQTNTLNNSLSQLAPVREPFVTLPLEKYAEHESVALVDLLRSHFGIPQPAQFYFGGNTSGSTKNLIFSNPDLSAKSTSASQQQQKLLTKVPTLLPLLFHRPLSASKNVFHRTSVEVPLEIDIGFLVHPQTLVAAQKEHRCNHRVGTYFRLYGFVTQTEGRFITYTRCGSIWGEDLFWKCEDEVVSGPIELGTRVNSKGIVIALYRAEIKARG